MDDKKTILIIVGSLLLLGGITAIALMLSKKNREDKEQEAREKELEEAALKAAADGMKASGNSSHWPYSDQNTSAEPSKTIVRPKFNTEGELSNPMSELKGKTLYAKSKLEGGYGYANARSSSHVDDGGWDYSDNLLKTFRGSTPIGRVVSETNTNNGGYSYRWFKVWFFNSVSTWWGMDSESHGWVRADVVTFK